VIGGKVTARSSHGARGEAAGATALKAEPEQKLSPAEKLERLPWTEPQQEVEPQVESRAEAKAHAAERRAEAKARGYEGEMCGECGNFTLVRNGTCLKCDTCGGTTGCS
jgi:ribonucleoside-diphosphate reductase alpha chain